MPKTWILIFRPSLYLRIRQIPLWRTTSWISNCRLSNAIWTKLATFLRNYTRISPASLILSLHVLKECAIELATSLCSLPNGCFDTGQVPSACKIAAIIPSTRRVKKTAESLRTFSRSRLTRLCAIWISWNEIHLNATDYDLDLTTGRHSETDRNQRAFSFKAFDSIPHERLLLKLKCYEIDGPLMSWFRNFLNGPLQRVVVRGTYSSWFLLLSNVLQGTILGPILFLIYVYDINSNISFSNISSKSKLVANDTKIQWELSNIEKDTQELQCSSDQLAAWT